ncbi:MAG: thiamine-phosphate kinase [Acidobacteria bacterium]|nr:thiamine-phosphate kinase [Acidobacteriota bacterium]
MRTEFEFIDEVRSNFGLGLIGDDCAVLPKDDRTDQVVTADLLIEGVDFRPEWTNPEYLGHKALAISLSDIAAMGADAKWGLLSIGIAEDRWKTDFLDKFYLGWHRLARKFGVELVGGDVSRMESGVVIDSIVGGEVPKGRAILRSGAHPGDGVFVTGPLGGAAGGLKLLESGKAGPKGLINKQLQPTPQIYLAKRLQALDLVSASIDISDGLSSDLVHLCKASGVGAEIDRNSVPMHPDLVTQFPLESCLEMAFNGGEDFELLFTANSDSVAASGIPEIVQIGEITDRSGTIFLIDGAFRTPLTPKGYSHF